MNKEKIMDWLAYILGIIPMFVSCNTGCSTGNWLNENSWVISAMYYAVIFIITIGIPKTIKLIAKIKKAKEDGKITSEELNEIADDVKDIANDVKDTIDNIKKD